MKNNIKFIRRLDVVYLFAVPSVIIFIILNNFVSLKETINFIFTFFCFVVPCFLLSNFMVKDVEAKIIKADNSFAEVVLVLYKKSIFLSEKIGNYYIFKTKNFIMPNIKFFVEANDKSCTIILPSIDYLWIKDSLKIQKSSLDSDKLK